MNLPHGKDEHLSKVYDKIMKLYFDENSEDLEPELYSAWKKKINNLMMIYNTNVGSRWFKLIK